MPHELIWKRRGVRVRFVGQVTPDEWSDVHRAVEAHPRFSELRYAIADFTEAVGLTLDAADPLAAEDDAALWIRAWYTNRRILLIAVIPDDAIRNALPHRPNTSRVPNEKRVFRTLSEATAWLASYLRGGKARTVREKVVRVQGHFDRTHAELLLGAANALAEATPMLVDLSAASRVEDSAVAFFARTLIGRRPFRFSGLSVHQERLLRYLGVPRQRARARSSG